jgi:hypothetical protein
MFVSYLKKSPLFSHAANSVCFQAAVRLSKALPFGNSGTTWKTKQPWIWMSFRDGAIMAEHLIDAQKVEKVSITVTVRTTLCFPRFFISIVVLTPSGQFLDCATIAFSERYDPWPPSLVFLPFIIVLNVKSINYPAPYYCVQYYLFSCFSLSIVS